MDVTELRVHGVSGTPPEVLVGDTAVEQVAGDDLVRFVRPATRRRRRDGPDVEGMSWGRLTSGPALQALWLVLLPLGLVNLAFWAGHHPERERFHALVRLLALTVTAVLALSITHVAVDLVAWQCRGQQCGAAAGVLGFADGWAPGTRVAVAAALPVLLLVVLTSLSRRASLRYEAVAGGPAVDPTSPDVTVFDRTPREEVADARHPSLDSPWMWRGESLARRLRILHLSTGFAVVAFAVGLVPDERGVASVTALVLAGAVVVVGAVLVTVPTPWTRWTTGSLRGEHAIGTVLVLGALGAVALAAVGAWGGGAPAWTGAPSALPRLPLVVDLLVAAQTVLLAALLVLRLLGPDGQQAGPDGTGEGALGRALGRVGPTLLASSGVLLGYAYSAAVSARVADVLRGTSGEVRLTGLRIFDWGATGFVFFVGILVFFAALMGSRVVRGRRRIITQVLHEYGYTSDELSAQDYRRWRDDHRVRRVALPRATSELAQVDNVLALLGFGAVAGLVVAALASASTVANLAGQDLALLEPPRGLVVVGSWMVTTAGVGLVALGVAGWRSETWRRRLGIAWDVVAFWPRAAHPLAPPSYCERAVPQLVARTCYLARSAGGGHGVVLSGHSQGSVICVAVVQQLWAVDPAHGLDRVGLLTHGSPLARAYATVFPHHFGFARLRTVDARLGRRWLNLFRVTDPIGASLVRVLGTDRDRRVSDPEGLDMDGSHAAYPPVRGHSGYDLADSYADAVDELTDLVSGQVRRV